MLDSVNPSGRVAGRVGVPGDKSVSHRSLILSALSLGTCRIENIGMGADVKATATCLESLGVPIRWEGDAAIVEGVGLRGFADPAEPLDCGNSGTTMRLLAGVLAGAGVSAEMRGDASLTRRPMRRILAPLRAMGAECSGRKVADEEFPPLSFSPVPSLTPETHALDVASAQVKSCLMLAALHAGGTTTIEQLAPTRTHTEHLLPLFGASLRVDGLAVHVSALEADMKAPSRLRVPGDPSSAAFLLVAAALHQDGDVSIPELCIEPLRIGFLDVLRRMGARVDITPAGRQAGDLVGEVRVQGVSDLQAMTIRAAEVPALLDEIPALAILASQATGETVIEGASELRVKESDRLAVLAEGLNSLGGSVRETEDGLIITGPTPLRAGRIDCGEDHRIAMAFALAGLVADGAVELPNAAQVDTSFPGFFETLSTLAEPR